LRSASIALLTALLLCVSLLTAAPPSRAAFVTAGGRCFQGAVLKGLGKTELAEQSFSECKAEAQATNPPKAQHWWSWAATAAKDIVAVIGFVLLALACVAGVLWALLLICSWGRILLKTALGWLPPRGRRFYESRGYKCARWIRARFWWIPKFFSWLTRPLLGPTLTVTALDGSGLEPDVGKAITSLIRGRFDPSATRSFTLVTGHAAINESLKSLGEISGEAKAAISLVSFFGALLPSQEYKAGGALQVPGQLAQGISLELTKNGGGFEAETVWAKRYEPPEANGTIDEKAAFQYLAFPAAAWIEHRVATRINNTGNLPDDPTVWMLFNAGLAWQQLGNKDKAKALYELALDRDPDDSWSMSNLGLIEPERTNFPKAERLLTRALEELDKKGIANRDNPDWYRTKYNLSVLHIERWMETRVAALGPPEVKLPHLHRQHARDFSREVAITSLEQLTKRRRRPSPSLLRLLQRWIVPSALSVYGGSEPARDVDPASVDYEWGPGGIDDDQRVLLGFLHNGLDRTTALRYTAAHGPRDPRILYNLACGWAERQDTVTEETPLDEALRYLREALAGASTKEREELVRSAGGDPSFGALRADPARTQEFERVLAGGG
jgi:tetratricopeptide (TPR) repeat protein